ncbi:MAG: FCD domain-containing protein, partial [Alphaproteobacteria bacterium]|nr:FCD domain-containing protein [Alphaproteobacteria bacterium]
VYENDMLNEKFNNKNDWKKNDSEFHQTLVKNCRSENLIKLHELIFDKYLRYQFLFLTFRGKDSILEHQKLLDFTLEKNYLKAQKVLEEHIYRGLDNTVIDSDTY